MSDAVQVLLQQENSPAPAHSSRGKFLADSPLVPALVMFIETPLYDVLNSQKAVDDDQIRQNRMRLSMAVDGHYRINEVVPRHFLQAAKTAGFGVVVAEEVLSGVVTELERALDKTLADLPDGFPQALAEAIVAGARRRAAAFHTV